MSISRIWVFMYCVALFPLIGIGLYTVGKIRFNSMNHVGHVLNDYFNRTNPQWRQRCKIITTQKNSCLTSGTLRLHYNAVLYNAVSAWLPNICPVCVKMSANHRGIHNANCENRTPCVFPSHQLISPEALSTGHSIYNAYIIGDHV